DRGWWMKVDPAGLPSVTEYRVLGQASGLTWLELRPLTGRTHQLRVHCAHAGFPILGDAVYGRAERFSGPPLHLHARGIVLPIDPKKPPLDVKAPPPPHMEERLLALGWAAEAAAPAA
ncbi:MAG: pseudouridine synthase, partial [Beijerinckiaceae bacterium]